MWEATIIPNVLVCAARIGTLLSEEGIVAAGSSELSVLKVSAGRLGVCRVGGKWLLKLEEIGEPPGNAKKSEAILQLVKKRDKQKYSYYKK